MLIEILVSFLPYAFVTGFTPGPNNILAFNTLSNYGWKKGSSVIMGIACGFLSVMLLCALGCFELARFLPMITETMKYIGAIYIMWLAIQIACSKPCHKNQTRNGSFWTGFVLQFVNVKIILYGITVYTGYVFPVSQSFICLLVAALCNTIAGVCGTLTWALAGGILKKYINKYYILFNVTMALVLAWSALKLIF